MLLSLILVLDWQELVVMLGVHTYYDYFLLPLTYQDYSVYKTFIELLPKYA